MARGTLHASKEAARPGPLVAVAYVRVSKRKQELSPQAQIAAIERWCVDHDASLVAVHRDIDVSGATPLDRCPALLAALDDLRDHEATILLLAKRDRLGRDVLKAAMVERMAQRVGAEVVSADGTANGNTPEAVLMKTMIDAFAQYERALIRARTRAALAVRKARGQRVGRVPFGSRCSTDGKLEPDATEQRTIEMVVALRQSGMSQQAIADHLNGQGVPTRGRRGEPVRWSQASVCRLLRREMRQLEGRTQGATP